MAKVSEIAHICNSFVELVRGRVDVLRNAPDFFSIPVESFHDSVLPDGRRRMKVGIIAGAFDVIHPGYILAFQEAKLHCSHLVICLHIDPSVERPEKSKPILSWQERKVILESIRYVDYVMPYATENDFLGILKHVDPDIRFLGQDYSTGIKAVTGAELNIPIHYLDRSHGWSSTKFKELICESEKHENPHRG